MSYCAHKVTEGFCLDCLRARVAELEAALTAILRHHDALCIEHGLAPNRGAATHARAALTGAAQPRGEP
jgi:hypothetical protein